MSLVLRVANWPVGRMAHAEDCKSFYIGSIPVPASTLFRLSSAVEQSAVNRLVVGSNPTVGANKRKTSLVEVFFYCPGRMRTNEKSAADVRLVRQGTQAGRKNGGCRQAMCDAGREGIYARRTIRQSELMIKFLCKEYQ